MPGRLQRLDLQGVPVIVDVAHNPQAARELAQWLQAEPVTGATHAVFAALSDKDVEGVVAALQQDVAHWHLAGLQDVGARGQDVDALAARLAASAAASGSRHTSVAAALQAVRSAAEPGDRILVLGSFHTAAEAIRFLRSGG